MRFGICAAPERAAELSELGFDFVEWPLRRTVGELDPTAYAELRQYAGRLPVVPETWNVLLPPEIKVVGPDADHARLTSYLDVALGRAAELGGSLVVFGSGGSRAVPEGWARERAERQLDEAFAAAGDIGRRHGVTIAIEPLNRGETNIVNSVAEATATARRLAHPDVRVLSDLFHVVQEGEDFRDTGAAGELLAHVHVSAADRSMPTPGRDDDLLREFFAVLHDAGYDERLSIECRWSTLAEAAAGLDALRGCWGRVADR